MMNMENYVLIEELLIVQMIDGISPEEMKVDNTFFKDSFQWQAKKEEVNSKKFPSIEDTTSNITESEHKKKNAYEEANEKMLLDLEVCNVIYRMPMISVSSQEWTQFFKELYSYYSENNLYESYVEDMAILNRMAIAKSLLNQQDEITLTTYISALRYMEFEVGITDILEMIDRLETTFQVENLKELIRNADGSYGNYDRISAALKKKGKMTTTFLQEDEKEKSEKEKIEDNVVVFQKNLTSRKNKGYFHRTKKG